MNYIPQTETNHRPLLMWIVVAFGTILVMAMILGAAFAAGTGHEGIAQTLYYSFSHVCHQMPERSFFILGHPFAVCSRCTGIYLGFTLASLTYPLFRSLRQTTAPPRKWLFIAAAPLVVDFLLGYFVIWNNTHSSRFVTGALVGAVAVFYVMPGLMDLALRHWRTSTKLPSVRASSAVINSDAGAIRPALSDYSAPHRRI